MVDYTLYLNRAKEDNNVEVGFDTLVDRVDRTGQLMVWQKVGVMDKQGKLHYYSAKTKIWMNRAQMVQMQAALSRLIADTPEREVG